MNHGSKVEEMEAAEPHLPCDERLEDFDVAFALSASVRAPRHGDSFDTQGWQK
jgi:hypothetical protein